MSCCLSFRPLRRTDLQQVNVELRILFEPDASSLPRIYQELGEDYHERVLPSICNEVCKAVIVSVPSGRRRHRIRHRLWHWRGRSRPRVSLLTPESLLHVSIASYPRPATRPRS